MTQQCKIYLDPWDKADLEGTAMLIDRIPDITERTYRGVTCQRWLVRFAPDQDNAKRWLDYGDAEPYTYPHLAPHVFTLGSPYIAIDSGSPALSFLSAHSIELAWELGNLIAAFVMPHDGFFRTGSIVYTVFAASGGANLTTVSIRMGTAELDARTLTRSIDPGGPYSDAWTRTPPKAFTKGQKITAALTGPQPAGENVALSNIIMSIFCSWEP